MRSLARLSSTGDSASSASTSFFAEASRKPAFTCARSCPAKFLRNHHGPCLPSNRQKTNGVKQCFSRQQQDKTPVSAQPAVLQVLGRERAPLGTSACIYRAARTNTKNGIEAVHADRRARGEACYPLLRADKKHGKVRSRKNQTRVFCRYGALLNYYEEQENNARKNRDQKTDPRARKHVMYKEAKIKQVEKLPRFGFTLQKQEKPLATSGGLCFWGAYFPDIRIAPSIRMTSPLR